MRSLEVGDKVKIKSLEWYNTNKDKDNYVYVGATFVPEMTEFCGKILTIKGKFGNPLYYRMVEDKDNWNWSEEFFESVNNNDDI